ncbi:PilW family protein [Pseudomonas wadenswilerensis]
MRSAAGFSLVEVLLAMSLGLLLLLAGSRVFISALHSWKAQEAAARLQEDARFALHRLAGDIRMAGMFGCLRREAMVFPDAATAKLFEQPFRLDLANDGGLQGLTLIGAEWGELVGAPNWTLVTDCRTEAVVENQRASPGPGMFAVPIRQQVYRLVDRSLRLGGAGSTAVLIDNVGRFDVRREDDRVMLSLTLEDPGKHVRPQTYELTVVLRNAH